MESEVDMLAPCRVSQYSMPCATQLAAGSAPAPPPLLAAAPFPPFQELLQRSTAAAEPCSSSTTRGAEGPCPQEFAAAVARTYVEHRRQHQQHQHQQHPQMQSDAAESWDGRGLQLRTMYHFPGGEATGARAKAIMCLILH
jgi:hypothetical protein